MRLDGGTRFAAVVLVLGLVGCSAPKNGTGPESVEARAQRLAHEILIVDTHVDFPERVDPAKLALVVSGGDDGHFDVPRARKGGLDAPFMAAYVPAGLEGDAAAAEADRLIALVESMASRWPDTFDLARTPDEVRDAAKHGRIALPMGLENGSPIRTLDDARKYRDRGIRYVTLSHSRNNAICDASFDTERRWHGLSPFGKELVPELNRLGVMIDVSHVSDETFDQVIELSRTPVVATHSSCRAFTPGWERNLDDARIEKLAAKGGTIQINFGAAFLTAAAQKQSEAAWAHFRAFAEERGLRWGDPELGAERDRYNAEHPPAPVTVADLANHIEHVAKLVGVEHVGLGSDFDGVDRLPEGIDDVSGYPVLIAELLRRGFSEHDIALICGENLLRVWAEIEAAKEPGA